MLLADMTWPNVGKLDRDTPVLIPVAALEQHGHHMPVFTDSMLLGEISRRAHATLHNSILMTPLMWLGNSHHHMDFPGTLSAEPRVYLDVLLGLMQNMIDHGFRRIVLLNGHGGNDVPGRQATFEMRQRHRERHDLLLLFATYWDLASPQTKHPELVQDSMGHACEWETSMVLRLKPETVINHTEVETVAHGNPFLPAHRAWIMPDRSSPGHVGDAAAATAEKGELLFECFAEGVTGLLQRVVAWDGQSWEG